MSEKILKYSVEDIYYHFGQYESHLTYFGFHSLSESQNKYGYFVSGIIIYTKTERELLEQSIQNLPYQRNNGIVHIESHLEDKEIVKQLRYEGFNASDVFELRDWSIMSKFKTYKKTGIKELPNQIVINVTPISDLEIITLPLTLYKQQISSGRR